MDESMVPARYFDAAEEPEQALVSIRGYETFPLVSLQEAVKPIKPLLYDADAMIEIARRNCRKPADGLTQDESSAIHLFTMQWPHPYPSLSKLLNERLRSANRDSLKLWFPFLKLFLTALYKLPSFKGTVWRGVRGNLSEYYEEDQIWWGASSCTDTKQQVEQFLGNEGARTIFVIQCLRGKSIRSHSYFKQETEIVLPPGSYFEVAEKYSPSKDLYMIHLREAIPPRTTIASPLEVPSASLEQMSMITTTEVVANGNTASVRSFADGHSDNESEIVPPVQVQKTHREAKRQLFRAPSKRSMSLVNNAAIPRLTTGQSMDSASSSRKRLMDPLRRMIRSKKSSESVTECKFYIETQRAVTVAGGNGQGEQLHQLSLPEGIFVDEHNTIYVADCWNHRLVQWKCEATRGVVVAGDKEPGKRLDQLNLPSDIILDKTSGAFIIADQGNRRVIRWLGQTQQVLIDKIDCYALAMDQYGFLYVSDYQKNEVRRWREGETEETLVAGGHEHGNHRNQLNYPTYIFVGEDQSVYVSDTFNDRVMRWSKGAREGVIVAGGNGNGNSLKQLSSPRGVLGDGRGRIYVADHGNDRVMCWREGEKEGSVVDDPKGEGVDPLKFPTGLSFDNEGNLCVVDQGHHRIQKYAISFE